MVEKSLGQTLHADHVAVVHGSDGELVSAHAVEDSAAIVSAPSTPVIIDFMWSLPIVRLRELLLTFAGITRLSYAGVESQFVAAVPMHCTLPPPNNNLEQIRGEQTLTF